MTDEIYEHLVYGGAEHHSMPVLVPELADRCIVVNGVAKTYAMTGWRVGWMIGPSDVIAAATNIQSHETSNVANVSQRAALAAVSGDLAAVAEMREAFDRRRRIIHRMLNEIDGVTCLEPEGAFYAFPVGHRPARPRSVAGSRPQSSAELAELCIDEAKVAVVPGEAFGAPGLLPHVLRPRRRRPRRGGQPAGRAVRLRRVEPRTSGSHESRRRVAVARVLVTEKIAQRGLDLLAAAGHEVDVQRGAHPRGAARARSPGPTPSSSARPPR